MRVLVCAFSCAPPSSSAFEGGESLLGWRLVEQLAPRFELTVLTYRGNKESIESAPSESADEARFVYVDLPEGFEHLRKVQGGIQLHAYLWQWKAYRVARRLHEEEDFALFHHLTYANDWMASYPGALLDVPYVRGPGGGSHTVPGPLARDRSFSFFSRQWLRTVAKKFFRLDPVFRRGQDRAERLLVCTEDPIHEYPENWSSKAELFPVSGVDPEDVPGGAEERDALTILAVGKLLPIKGFDLALRAFARFGDESAKFVIVGDGPERERLEALSSELGVGDSVRFQGWRSHEEVMRWMASADVFLFPSMRDGGGTVVVEAMAAGTPVVCLDHAGPGVHVTEEVGIAVEPGDRETVVEAMAEALRRLAEDADLRSRLGKEARQRARETYSWEALGDRLAEVYQEAAEEALTAENAIDSASRDRDRRKARSRKGSN